MVGYDKVEFCCGNQVMSIIYYNYATEDVICHNFTSDPFDKALPEGKNSWKALMDFMEERTFPHTRYNVKQILECMDMQYYDALEIAIRTHGVQSSDDFYLRFNDEEVNYDDISVRRY